MLPGENLDHVGRTTTAPIASLPCWRRCLGSPCRWWSPALFGEDPFLRLPFLSFLYIAQAVLVISWRMLCHPSTSRYFAAVLLWRMLCRRRCWLEFTFRRMLCRRCWLVAWMLCHLICVVDLRAFGDVVSFSRFSFVWSWLGS